MKYNPMKLKNQFFQYEVSPLLFAKHWYFSPWVSAALK